MDAREGHHATELRDPPGLIDHPNHEDHDPASEIMKGGVCSASACPAGVGTDVASNSDAEVLWSRC
jgi:hypothetical protein